MECWSVGVLVSWGVDVLRGNGYKAKKQKSRVSAITGLARCNHIVQGNLSIVWDVALRNETDCGSSDGLGRLCPQEHCGGLLSPIYPRIYPLSLHFPRISR